MNKISEHEAFKGATRTPDGLWLPGGVQIERKPTAIDLFSGCGGFSLGFLRAGFDVLAAVDKDVAALTTYWSNLCGPGSKWIGDARSIQRRDKTLGNVLFNPIRDSTSGFVRAVFCVDVRTLTGAQILAEVGRAPGDIDCVIGGPPCQGFSQANNKRSVHDPRNSLVWEFARLVHEIKPKTFVMENVPEMVNMTTPLGVPIVKALLRAFEDEGYLAVTQKLDEAIKQSKKKAGVVGMKRGVPTVELAGEQVQLELPL